VPIDPVPEAIRIGGAPWLEGYTGDRGLIIRWHSAWARCRYASFLLPGIPMTLMFFDCGIVVEEAW